MTQPFEMVGEFIRVFGGSLDARLWINLIKEETAEFNEALANEPLENQLKEAADVLYVSSGFAILTEGRDELYNWLLTPEEKADWDLTIIESRNAMAKATGIFGADLLTQAFERVHKSNMSKLGKDGKPIRRKDGKVLKGPNYQAPDLSDLIQNI